jgi:hypothetical protein
MTWANNGTVPLFHEDIVSVCEPVRASAIADTLFSLFEFFK